MNEEEMTRIETSIRAAIERAIAKNVMIRRGFWGIFSCKPVACCALGALLIDELSTELIDEPGIFLKQIYPVTEIKKILHVNERWISRSFMQGFDGRRNLDDGDVDAFNL